MIRKTAEGGEAALVMAKDRVFDVVAEAGQELMKLETEKEVYAHIRWMEYAGFEEFKQETGFNGLDVLLGNWLVD